MATVRRWYIFLVCFISLQSVAWAVIALVQDLFASGGNSSIAFTAFQIAVIIIGLPVFLAHWLWAQRLAGKDSDERASALRRLYLYGTLAAFLSPFAVVVFDLLATLLSLPFGAPQSDFAFYNYSPGEVILRDLIALIVLGLLWFYHRRITTADAKACPEIENAATVRRLYVLGFSAGGVWAVTVAVMSISRWIMGQFGGGDAIRGFDTYSLTNEVARLMVGLALWLPFWLAAQKMFTGMNQEERESALRKFYLYANVLIASLSVVTNITLIVAGLFRRLLGLPSLGDIRDPLSVILGLGILWAYHSYVLRGDAALAGEAPRQAGVRRLYLYLVAAVGLAAFLVGLSGDISVLIRSLSDSFFGDDLKEQLAWFTAALIAGLPVWLLPWRPAQIGAVAAGATGAEERHSVIRKIYLYFYLFVATMTVLSSAVYILFRLLSIALGERFSGNLLNDLAHAIAFSLIAVGVWLYHGYALRSDGQINKREHGKRLTGLRVAVVDTGDGQFGRALLDGLQRELPGIILEPIGLTQPAAQAMGGTPENIPGQLAAAGLIVGPWNIAVAGEAIPAEVAAAVVAGPARKLLVPTRADGWDWAGVDRWNTEAIVRQTVQAVKQIVAGEEVKPARPLAGCALIGAIVGAIILLILLAIPVLYFFALRGF